ncbi:MAG: hypothetical protein JWP04_3676 [Belnapia sp.]|nr:hypothetical protein [Belnapia sp.]
MGLVQFTSHEGIEGGIVHAGQRRRLPWDP